MDAPPATDDAELGLVQPGVTFRFGWLCASYPFNNRGNENKTTKEYEEMGDYLY